MSSDGYALYRALKHGGSEVIDVHGQRYELGFEGPRTGINSWLRVTNEQGGSIRLAPGWSSEACWSALTTLEQRRWNRPQGEWKDPSDSTSD